MKALVRSAAPAEEFFTEEQCHILEVSNSPQDQDVSVARARVEPGVVTRWHRLKDITERYYILSGCGEVEVGDLPPQRVEAGAFVLIPPMAPQRIRNIGQEDLIFLAICTPRFRPEAYQDIDPDPPPQEIA